MRLMPRGVASALLTSSLFVSLAHAQISVVRVAVDPTTPSVEAWLSGETGLFVTGWTGAPGNRLDIGRGAYPRFGVGGDLYFVRGVDDGDQVISMTSWRVRRGSTTLHKLPEGTVLPPYVLPPLNTQRSATRICLDPGHGGSDPGAVGQGLQEATVNLDVALKLKSWLDRDTADTSGGGSWTILMTRTTNVFVSLCARANMANAFGAATFLSVHHNAFSLSSANGTETFCFTGQENNAGGALRNIVQAEAINAWGLRNRGNKAANFAVLRLTSMPAALVECGFITSPIDVVKIGDPAERDNMALHLMYAWQQHHGFGRYRPGGGGGGQTGTLKGVLYDLAQGTGARLGGAIVSLSNGTFVVSRTTDGYFEFSTAAGNQAYAATLPGYTAASSSRSVPANGEVWGSIGMSRSNVPAFTLSSFPQPRAPLNMRISGDVGSSAILLVATRPGVPVVSLNAFGLGTAWPLLAGAASTTVGVIPGSGTLSVPLLAPSARGVTIHCQALVRNGGVFRLTNGEAFTVQ